MIKRKYFFYTKVAHNNNTGKYSWWYSVITYKSFFEDIDEVLSLIKAEASARLRDESGLLCRDDDIEITSFSRIK